MTNPHHRPASPGGPVTPPRGDVPEAVLTVMMLCVVMPAFIWFAVGLGELFWTVTAVSAVGMVAAAGWGAHTSRN